MKEIDSINEFKHVIKICKPDLCSCKLSKIYLQNIGYLQSGKKHICLGKLEYHNRLPYVVHLLSLV